MEGGGNYDDEIARGEEDVKQLENECTDWRAVCWSSIGGRGH